MSVEADEAVGIEEMIGTAAARTAARSAGRHVLAIQDTTTIRAEAKGAALPCIRLLQSMRLKARRWGLWVGAS